MATPIFNPPIPFLGLLPGGFGPGQMVRIQGSVPYQAQRFAINLQCGPNVDPHDDIAFHANFHFSLRIVCRNSLSRMSWGPEETTGALPLQPGSSFEALLLCEPNSIKMALNGMHFCEFIHRLPYQSITHLSIDGDVQVNSIAFEGSAPAPQQYAPPPVSYAQPSYGGAPPPYVQQPAYSSGPMYAQQGMPMQQQQRSGMGTGAALGLGAGALAAGGLAGYALGGGFGGDDHDNTTVVEDVQDFGGDDWMD